MSKCDERRAGSGSIDSAHVSRVAGFALIELAIVIVIMSLLLGGGLLALNSQTENQRINTTQRQMEVVKVALQNFIAREGRLPCPARADLAPTSANYGVEAPRATGPANCTGTIAAGGGFKGVVPWVTLGLTSPEVLDGWQHRFTYHVSQLGVFDATGNVRTIAGVSGMRGALTVHSDAVHKPSDVDEGLPPTGNQTNGCSSIAGDNKCNNAAIVVLVSHGKNGLGAWQENGTQLSAPPADSREKVNTDADSSYLSMQFFESDDADHFDDFLLALAPRDLLTSLVEAKQVKAESAVLSEGFELLKAGVISWALKQKSGDEYPLPDSAQLVASLAPNVPKDPWGSDYQYLNDEGEGTGVDKIKLDTDPGPACTFVSLGPDRDGGTPPKDADNIVIVVSVAELKSIFAKTGF